MPGVGSLLVEPSGPLAATAGAEPATTSPAGRRGSEMTVSETAGRAELTTREIARLLASGMRDELLALMREMFERNAYAERLAYSPDEAAELLGISKELVHDLLRTGQLGSVKAGRRRLIGKHHLEAFLVGGQ